VWCVVCGVCVVCVCVVCVCVCWFLILVIHIGTSVLYTDRPGFIEHKTLERALQENVSCAPVEVDEVVKCLPSLWKKADSIVPNTVKPPLGFNGAEQAADIIMMPLCSWPKREASLPGNAERGE